MTHKNRHLYPLAVLAVITVVCMPFILLGVQTGHSLALNISWANGFIGQFWDGELYPRWLVDMNEGAGSPVFFFYGPLPFYLMAPVVLFCPGCEINIVLGITGWLIMAMSGLAFYVFARQYAAPLASTIGSLLYVFMPYHFAVDLLIRQAIGEIAAYIWIPLILYFTRKMAGDRFSVIGFAFSYACLILSHLPSALLFSMFLPLYAGFLAYQNRSPAQFYVFLSGVLLGMALAGIYLVPAVLSQGYITASQWWVPEYQYHQWFFLDGVAAPNPQFGDGLFLALLFSTLVFCGVWLVAFRQHEAKERASLFVWLLFAAGAWYLMTPVSRFLWELLPFLYKVQFPWRVAVVLDFAVAITFVVAMRDVPVGENKKFVLISSLAAVLLIVSGGFGAVHFVGQWKMSQSAEYQERFQDVISMGHDASEYLPASATLPQSEIWRHLKSISRIGLDADNGRASVTRWKARDIVLDVDLSAETKLVVRQFYYPGWQARIAGGGGAVTIAPAGPAGLIELIAPPGRYRLELALGWSLHELAGAAISVSGLLIVLFIVFLRFLRRWQYQFPWGLRGFNAISTVGRR
ncbi:MAG: 6-pyruvoyl-tetrahydropterin synthase-related protein [Alphaproteobacteria bacterium]|nr:6-pyruvoyl-tetrahydropterin synthase-related protein [Alphaproteobacteria bacterium]